MKDVLGHPTGAARGASARGGRRRAAALAALLGLCAGCRSGPDPELVAVAEEGDAPSVEDAARALSGSTIAVVGAPNGLASDIAKIVAPFAEDYGKAPRAAFVDDAAYEIELFLQGRGYAAARTRFEAQEGGPAAVFIEAGERSTLGDVEVRVVGGTSPISVSDLALYVSGPTTGLFGRGPRLYVQDQIRGVPDRIRQDLESLGHLDAEVRLVEGREAPAAGGPVRVVLEVDPGRKYRVSGHQYELMRTAPSLGAQAERRVDDAIVRTLESKDGRLPVFEPRLAGRLRGAVADALATSGYPDALVEITPKIDAENARVRIDVFVDPGPYVLLSGVEIKGEKRTAKSFLRSRLRIEDGDVYDAAGVRKSLRELYRTGLFSQVTADLQGEGEQRSLLVEVVERPAIELYAEPGYGSYELARMTLGARHRNLFGHGIGSTAEITAAVRALRATVGLTDPWFLRRDLIGDLRVEFDRREEPSFTRESRGIGAFVTKEWTRDSTSTFGYRFRRSQARDIEAVDVEVLDVQSAVNVSAFIVTQTYDVRDALFAPTEGLYAEGSLEIAADGIGSELEFLRGRLSSAYFHSLGENDVVGFSLRMGVIAPAFNESTIPLQERFFAGGENSVRSFLESRLGPADADGSPLGGETFGTASIEWRRQIAGPIQTALFVDAGFVEQQAEDVFALDDVRMGVGLGFRYLLPIGPLRIDAGFNPDKRTGEDEWVVHFAIGMPF